MKIKKRTLAILLAVTLVMTSMPTTFFAKETVTTMQPMIAFADNYVTTSPAIEVKPTKYIGDGYEVEFRIVNKWNGAFQGELILTNTSDKPLENWALQFDCEDEISNIWNAQIVEHESNNYIIKNVVYNQDIAVGSSVSIGFQANWNDDIKIPKSYNLLIDKQKVENTDYTIDFKVTSDWSQAFNGEISITNNTEEVIEDWILEFDFDRNIERFWTAEIVKHEGEHYIVKNAGYNANIAPRQTITLGFAGNPGNVDNEPQNYKLNMLTNKKQDKRVEVVPDGSASFKQIKPSTEDDIVRQTIVTTNGAEVEIEYVKNQIIFLANKGVNFEDIKQMLKPYDGVIVGYIARTRRYQVEFLECTYEELQDKIELISQEMMVKDKTVALNYIDRMQSNLVTPNDPWDGSDFAWSETNPNEINWGVEAIKAPSAWEYNQDMNPVNVGVIDTRFSEHEDLNFVELIDNEGENNIHATHVSGTIAALPNNETGITGVAWNANLYGQAFLSRGAAPVVLIEDAIDNLFNDERNVRIINYSAGYRDQSMISADPEFYSELQNSTLGAALETYLEEGHEFLIVCAAGNSAQEGYDAFTASQFTLITTPEIQDRIIVVGAVGNLGDDKYAIADFSQGGNRVDVVAPGVNIYSTIPGGYESLDGTSMATPHVTGIASMVWGLDERLSGAQVKEAIVTTADRNVERDGVNYRMVNALSAVERNMDVGKANGIVKDAATQEGIQGATITVDGNKTYTTNSDGTFSIHLLADKAHTIKVEKEGYMDVYYYNILVEKDQQINLTAIMQLPASYQNMSGKVTGQVVSALTGNGMSGLSIKIRAGINNQDGEVIDTITTDNQGDFTTGLLKNGVYTGEIVGDNIIKTYFSFACIGEESSAGVIAVTPLLSGDEMRIVLTWGANPSDLDSHLQGGIQHVYYGNKIGTGVNLDHDDTTSYGPETITVNFNQIPAGEYEYYVDWYAGTGTWGTSEARVQVYIGSELKAEYFVPAGQQSIDDRIWRVFKFDTATKKITNY